MRIVLPFLLLASCAGRPGFRASETAPGYVAKATPVPEILVIRAKLELGTDEKGRADYLTRAAGEECAARGYAWFDLALARDGSARAFCYKEDKFPTLGAVFTMKAQASTPPELRVEDTQMGKFAPLRPWDLVRKVNGREVRDVADVKDAIFLASRQGLKRVAVQVERSEIALNLDCPLTFERGKLFGPEKLAELRQQVR